jgi:hypothetical protein
LPTPHKINVSYPFSLVNTPPKSISPKLHNMIFENKNLLKNTLTNHAKTTMALNDFKRDAHNKNKKS